MELFVFVCATAMIIVGALGVVLRKHPVHAEFLAAVQVIVYAGAIVVLFLFVIMLLGVDQVENLKTEPLAGQRWVAGVVGVSLLGLLAAAIYTGADSVLSRGEGIASNVAGDNPDANIQQLATSIFSDYVVAFEVTSILLVVTVVGTVLLSRRRTAGKP